MSTRKLLYLCKNCVTSTLMNCSKGTKILIFGKNSEAKYNGLLSNLNAKLNLMGLVLAEQCNKVAAFRLRRAYQILQLYQRIYGERFLLERLQRIKMNLTDLQKGKSLFAMLSAAFFDWKNERVTDGEISRLEVEASEVHKLVECMTNSETCDEMSEWEQIVDSKEFLAWRKFDDETGLYIYRVFGHFTDITPRSFFNTQVDLPFWKVWDSNTLEVNIVETDPETKSEVIHWLYNFPYPLAPRDYVYVRRYVVDQKQNAMIITAKATDHPQCPLQDGVVRVEVYTSQMVIKPHTTFDENGFEYTMTYCDDPKTNFPTFAYKWMASTGVHQFLEKVHQASKKKLRESPQNYETSTNNLYNNIAA